MVIGKQTNLRLGFGCALIILLITLLTTDQFCDVVVYPGERAVVRVPRPRPRAAQEAPALALRQPGGHDQVRVQVF